MAFIFFFKQKTAYDMRISDWSSDVCSSDLDLYDTLVQGHAAGMREEIDALEHWALKMQAINRHLFEDLGYAGDHDQYYDPRNSYLNEVFERRRGNPISLAMVQMEVARRLGVDRKSTRLNSSH